VHGEPLKCASTLKFEESLQIKHAEKNQLLVVIPLGIPGMGKTTFVHILRQLLHLNQWEFKVLSGDEMRSNMMDEWMQRNKSKDEQKAFDGTHKQ